ncbi:STAS-like domain-containing protein [Sneathiella limimaris]|uniref:STAS-like domain-containing protein n=1 Tax=Sneathiella limimaris TaxID=1964213 RepID=UPI00146F447B|nr:STAS-like domain-containing protein [Sneathiella limimaris]
MRVINLANDFSDVPAGRFVTDGPFSGEKFRKSILVPAFKQERNIVVELDGGEGHGSSFLEEAFGGLIREEKFSLEELEERLVLDSKDELLVAEIWEYIKSAENVGLNAK